MVASRSLSRSSVAVAMATNLSTAQFACQEGRRWAQDYLEGDAWMSLPESTEDRLHKLRPYRLGGAKLQFTNCAPGRDHDLTCAQTLLENAEPGALIGDK